MKSVKGKLRFKRDTFDMNDAYSNIIHIRGFDYQLKVENYYKPLTTIPIIHFAINPQNNFKKATRSIFPINDKLVYYATGFNYQDIDTCLNVLFDFLTIKTCEFCGHYEGLGVIPQSISNHKEFQQYKNKNVCKDCYDTIQKQFNEKLKNFCEKLLSEELGNSKSNQVSKKFVKKHKRVVKEDLGVHHQLNNGSNHNKAQNGIIEGYKYTFTVKIGKTTKAILILKDKNMTEEEINHYRNKYKVIYGAEEVNYPIIEEINSSISS